ncbi:MAG: hypothetical protein WAV76_13815 [Bacteroidota bacterium]
MQKKYRVVLFFLAAAGTAMAQQPAGDRLTVDLTIYNQNLALIHEVRSVDLSQGINEVVLPDIPSTIDATSLQLTSLSDHSGIKVLEQSYQYDLVHQAKLLEKYIGKQVEFIRISPDEKKEYSVKGKLLSTGWEARPENGSYSASGKLIAEINGKIEIDPAGKLILPSLPDGLVLKPQLQWLMKSEKAGTQKIGITYLASQISWHCDYVALLGEHDDAVDLNGWVTVENHSGTTFENAGLKLVAGDVNIVQESNAAPRQKRVFNAMLAQEDQQFQQKELFEYKLYSLQRRTDIVNNETKQIELVAAQHVAAKKVLVYDGLAGQWRSWRNQPAHREQAAFGQQSNPKVGVFVKLINSEESGLGMPLPKGKVRVYKKDSDGKEQFIGEDDIDHTPKDEEIRLYMGDAFDVVGERVQKSLQTVVTGHSVEETMQIKVRNHKTEPVDVLVYEHPWRWSTWEITQSSTAWTKVDQSTLQFPVTLTPDEEKTITYTVRYTW